MSYLPLSPAGRRYGRFHDNPFHPARKLLALRADPSIVLPPTAMGLCAYKGPTRNQGNEGSCCGQAGAAKVDLDYRQFSNWPDRSVPAAQFEASAEFVYLCDLIADGDLGTDAGSTLHQTAMTISQKGACINADMPYSDSQYSIPPSAAQYSEGLLYRMDVYHFLPDLPSMKACIAPSTAGPGHSFIFGINVYSSFEGEWDAPGFMPIPDLSNEQLLGGHAQHCFSGDTKVSLLDGTERTFIELCEQFQGRTFWVYSCDTKGNIVPGLAHSVRKTGVARKIVKVKLDNGEEIRCTPDHLFLMRNGSYKAVSDLRAGDSLMPLYRKVADKDLVGYEMLLNPTTHRWLYTHRHMYVCVHGRYTEDVIHHEDFHKRNNAPDNLRAMSWEDHTLLHSQATGLLEKYATSEKGRETSRRLMTALWSDPEWRAKSLLRASENGKRTSSKLIAEGKHGYQTADKAILVERARNLGLKNAWRLNTPDIQARSAEGLRRYIANNPEYAQNLVLRAAIASQRAAQFPTTEAQRLARRRNAAVLNSDPELKARAQMKTTYTRFYKQDYLSFDSYIAARGLSVEGSPNNHKVASVEDAGYEDVYDLTVDTHHNFALSSGVFVHNCIGYDDTIKFPDGSLGGLFVQNSWGDQSAWAQGINAPGSTDGGSYWMPYAFVTGNDPNNGPFTSDAWINHGGPVWK